jgi:hypothetical protein
MDGWVHGGPALSVVRRRGRLPMSIEKFPDRSKPHPSTGSFVLVLRRLTASVLRSLAHPSPPPFHSIPMQSTTTTGPHRRPDHGRRADRRAGAPPQGRGGGRVKRTPYGSSVSESVKFHHPSLCVCVIIVSCWGEADGRAAAAGGGGGGGDSGVLIRFPPLPPSRLLHPPHLPCSR